MGSVRGERRFLSLNKYLTSEVKVELVYSTMVSMAI